MTWLSVIEVALLMGITAMAVRKNAYSGKYQFRYIDGKGGNSGKVLQIALESLPLYAQDEYNRLLDETERQECTEAITNCTDKQREAADHKASIVHEFELSGMSGKRFIEQYNKQSGESVSLNQLYDWRNRLDRDGIAALVDKRGGQNRGTSSIPDEAWELFKSWYLTPQRRSIQMCYNQVKEEYPNIPSISAFERRVRKEFTEYIIMRYRGNYKDFRDALPYHERTKVDVESNEIWSSDHHTCDTFVLDKRGNVVRPTLTVITDIRSTRVMAFRVRDSEGNTSVVKQCLRDGMIKFGVPLKFYTDNGKDYTSKELSQDYPDSLVNALGIKQILAQPYHGQSKPVERFFKTFEEHCGKLFRTYSGSNAVNRPDDTRMLNKKLAEKPYTPTIDQYIEVVSAYIEEYNSTAHSGRDMDGKSPNAVYLENLHHKREVKNPEVLRLLCGRFITRTVGRNGIRMNNTTFTEYEGKLLPYYKKKVTVVYDPEDMSSLTVLEHESKRFICNIQPKVLTPFGAANEEDFRRAAKQRKKALDYVNGAKPRRLAEHQTFSIISKNKLLEKNFEEEYSKRVEEIPSDSIETPLIKQTEKSVSAAHEKVNKGNTAADETEDVCLSLYEYYKKNKEDMA